MDDRVRKGQATRCGKTRVHPHLGSCSSFWIIRLRQSYREKKRFPLEKVASPMEQVAP
jgi:hypothetical protein